LHEENNGIKLKVLTLL